MSLLLPVGTAWPTVLPVGTPWGQLLPIGSGLVYNVMDYGAHADGATDDAAHVQAAVDACHAAGGGTVYMPAGTYCLHATTVLGGTTVDEHGGNLTGSGAMQTCVNVKSGVHVLGAGTGQTFVFNDDDYSGPFGAYGQSDVGLSHMDLTTTMGTAGGGEPFGGDDGSKCQYCNNVTFDNMLVRNLYVGLTLLGCHDSVISNSIATGCYTGFNVGLGGEVGARQLNVNSGMINCEAYGGTTGIRIQGAAPGSASMDRCNDAYLTDCYAHDNSASAFRIKYSSNLTFLRCIGEDSYEPMCLINVAGAHLTDCTAASLVTSASDNAWWVTEGSLNCTDIVED